MDLQQLRDALTEAIRYWEPRRILYNIILATIVLTCFSLNYPASKGTLSIDNVLFIFVLAVLANVAYCAAYAADLFAQLSGFRPVWLRYRWVLLMIGILFAGVITRWFALAFFSPGITPNSPG